MADPDGVGASVGLKESPSEDRLVVLDADLGQYGQAGEQEKEARNQRRQGIKRSKSVWLTLFGGGMQLEIVTSWPMSDGSEPGKV